MMRIRRTPLERKRQVLSPSASAMIDASMIITVVFLFAIAALMLHRPDFVATQLPNAGDRPSVEPLKPAVQIEVRAGSLTLRAGPEVSPLDIEDADLAAALESYRDVPGPVGLCVAEGIDYHKVVDLWRTITGVLGNRELADCGGLLR